MTASERMEEARSGSYLGSADLVVTRLLAMTDADRDAVCRKFNLRMIEQGRDRRMICTKGGA